MAITEMEHTKIYFRKIACNSVECGRPLSTVIQHGNNGKVVLILINGSEKFRCFSNLFDWQRLDDGRRCLHSNAYCCQTFVGTCVLVIQVQVAIKFSFLSSGHTQKRRKHFRTIQLGLHHFSLTQN